MSRSCGINGPRGFLHASDVAAERTGKLRSAVARARRAVVWQLSDQHGWRTAVRVVEGVQQLRGEDGARQARFGRGVLAGDGMVAYGRGLSCNAAIIGPEA